MINIDISNFTIDDISIYYKVGKEIEEIKKQQIEDHKKELDKDARICNSY